MPDLASTAKRASVFLVLGIGLFLRLGFLVAADEPALVRIVPDDAYYYFKVARNLVEGHGPSFDGIYPTNGYHPLWMAMLLPAAALVRDPHLFVRVALGLGIALSLATAILLHSLVRRLCEDGAEDSASDLHASRVARLAAWWLPLLALILYWLNPRSVVSSLNGLETSLSTFLFTLVLFLVFHAARGTRHAALHPVALGLLMGALFLARTDNLFFIAAFWLAAIAFAGRAGRARNAVVMAAGAAVVGVPWIVYNWVMFGSPIQVSGLSIPYVHHVLYSPAAHHGLPPLLFGLKRFAVMLYEGLRGEIGYSRLVTFPALAAALLTFILYWWNEAMMPRATRRVALVLLGLGLASLAHLFVHSAIRWYPRPWYFDQLLVLLPVIFALALYVLLRKVRPRASEAPSPSPLRLLVPLALGGLVAWQSWQSVVKLRRGEWPWAVEMLDAARWLRYNTEKDAVAAAFNAGIIGYYSDRRVVNLDGAINNAAYVALRQRDLMGLMRRAGVSYFLDFEPIMLDLFRPFLGPLAKQITALPVPRPKRLLAGWEGSHIEVFELEWPSEGRNTPPRCVACARCGERGGAMKAALVVHKVGPDLAASVAAMEERIREAAAAGAGLVLFPEAAPTGLANKDDPAHDLPLGQPIPGPLTERLGAAARRCHVHVATGLLEREGDRLYDSAILLGPAGGLLLAYRRLQPQWHGRDADPNVYRQGDRLDAVATPLGRLAFLLCGDLFDDGIVARLRRAAPDVVLFPFCRNFADGCIDQQRWDREEGPAYAARAALTGSTVLMVNLLEDPATSDWPSFGGAMVVSPSGEITARFPLGRPGILYTKV